MALHSRVWKILITQTFSRPQSSYFPMSNMWRTQLRGRMNDVLNLGTISQSPVSTFGCMQLFAGEPRKKLLEDCILQM